MSEQKPLPKLLTEGEAAAILRISSRTLRQIRSEGRIHHVRIGRKVAYTEQDCINFIEACTVRARPPQPTSNSVKPRRNASTGAYDFETIIAMRRKKK